MNDFIMSATMKIMIMMVMMIIIIILIITDFSEYFRSSHSF